MTRSHNGRPSAAGVSADVIPGPRPRPLIGNALDIGLKGAVESAIKLARQYGPIYRLVLPGGAHRYIVSGSDLVEEVCDERRFHTEVDSVLGTDIAVFPSYDQVRKLSYVRQILEESLRRRAFMDVFREHSGKAEADADAWLAGLRADDRYLEDVWGGSTTSPVPG